MHVALDFCFVSSETRVPPDQKSSVENCQDLELSTIFDGTKPNYMKNAGMLEGDKTMHIAQTGNRIYAHNET